MSITWNIETDSPLIMMFAMVEANKVFRILRLKWKLILPPLRCIQTWEGRRAWGGRRRCRGPSSCTCARNLQCFMSYCWLWKYKIQLLTRSPPSLATPTLVSNSSMFAFSANSDTLKATSLLRARLWSLMLNPTSLLKLRSRRVKVGAMFCFLNWEEASPPPTWVALKVKGRSGLGKAGMEQEQE